MLGTNSALLLGHLHPSRFERSVTFKMDQVQAHVVCADGCTGGAAAFGTAPATPLWLRIANGKLCTPPGAEGIMRQVLDPFKVYNTT